MGSAGTSVFARFVPKLSGLFSFGGAKSAIGLSIGTSSIKLVELKKDGESWRLLHFGMIPLSEGAVINREIISPIVIIDAIKALLSQIKLKSNQVCTCLSGSSLIIKRMTVDVQNPKELSDQVFWEAEQYLPFDINDVVMDFHLLSTPGVVGPADVLLVGVKKNVLESYMDCIKDAGLTPSIIDVDFFSLQNVVELTYPVSTSEAVAAVDIGASSLKIVVTHNGTPVFTKDSALGGNSLTSEIQKHLNISFQDAENLKLSPAGSAIPQEVSDLVQIMCENYALEIKRALDFYNASSSGAPVAYIVLTGGTSKISALSKIIEDHTGLPTQNLNPFNSIVYDPSVFTPEYLTNIAPFATIPIGLALRAGAP